MIRFEQVQVSEVMRDDALCIPADACICDAVQVIVHASPDWYPVIDSAGLFCGVVTLHDLLRRFFPMVEDGVYPDIRALLAEKVSDLISREYPPVSPQDNIRDVIVIMMKKNHSSLPVLNEGVYVGMVRLHEIARLLPCTIE